MTYVDPPKSVRRLVNEAWRNRHLVRELGLHTIKRMYSRTYLPWIVIRPTIDAAGGAILFGGVLSVTTGDGTPYLLFFTAGILGWRVFERMLIWVTRSFDRVRARRRLDFPLLLIPVCGGAPALIDLAVYLALLLVAVAGYLLVDGHLWLRLGPQILAAGLGLLLCLTFGLAIGLYTSVINAHARDVKYAIRYVLQLWLFVTPVIYPVTKLPPDLRPVAYANPMAAPVELIKYGLFGSEPVALLSVLWSCLAIFGAMASGLWFFTRRASNFMGPAGWDADEEEEEDGIL